LLWFTIAHYRQGWGGDDDGQCDPYADESPLVVDAPGLPKLSASPQAFSASRAALIIKDGSTGLSTTPQIMLEQLADLTIAVTCTAATAAESHCCAL